MSVNAPVLLVDDDPIVVRMYAAAVNQMGLDAIIAESASEALPLIKDAKPALVISDLQMPGQGGDEFVMDMIFKGLKTMPVMLLTGYDDIATVKRGLTAGADDILIKGLPIDKIRNRIAFWTVSGFAGLPDEIRRRALKMAQYDEGESIPSLSEVIDLNPDVVARVAAAVQKELKELPRTYGYRYVERLMFLGRVSRLALEQCKNYGDVIRFPDLLYAVVQRLDVPWKGEIAPILMHFEEHATDYRFARAGVEPLKSFQEYPWMLETVA